MGLAGKIIGGTLGTLALGVFGYVLREVQKEYDSTVDENNRLKQFIDDHDFYERQPESDNNSVEKRELSKVDEYVNSAGQYVNVFQDAETGFKLIKVCGTEKKNA